MARSVKVRTRYVVTNTNPDDIDPDGFDDQLEECAAFRSEAAARKELRHRLNGGTNMCAYLLRIELLDAGDGSVNFWKGR